MPNPYGRPRTFKRTFNVRLPHSLLAKLFLAHPEIFKPHNPRELRHGGLSDYLTRLVKSDLDAKLGSDLSEALDESAIPEGYCPHGRAEGQFCPECAANRGPEDEL